MKREAFSDRSGFGIHLGGQAEDLLHQLLRLRRLLEEQLDDGGQQSELDLEVRPGGPVRANPRLQTQPWFRKLALLRGWRQAWNPHLGALIVEALEETLQQLVGVVDPLGVFPDDPDHGGARVRLVQRVEILAQRRDDAFVPGQHTHGKPRCFHGRAGWISAQRLPRLREGTYLFGYLRKMSLMTTMASWTT